MTVAATAVFLSRQRTALFSIYGEKPVKSGSTASAVGRAYGIRSRLERCDKKRVAVTVVTVVVVRRFEKSFIHMAGLHLVVVIYPSHGLLHLMAENHWLSTW